MVREFVHKVVRQELKRSPSQLYFTGHSLGGALATLAAADVTVNTLPRVNHYLRCQFLREVYRSSYSRYPTQNLARNNRWALCGTWAVTGIYWVVIRTVSAGLVPEPAASLCC